MSLRSSRMILAAAHSPGRTGRLAVGAGGLLASVAIHVLLIQAIVMGGRGVPASRILEGLGANSYGVPDEATATLYFVEDSSVTTARDISLNQLASAGKVLQSLGVMIISADPSIDAALRDSNVDERTLSTDEESAGERAARATLFGRYVGQIQARIERAWLRPRAAIGAASFDCQAQVSQNQRGEVDEVTLQHCNGSPQWQLSLVRAIERASPLPAPPDSAVFSSSILLSFQAEAYGPGSYNELYEPETAGLATTTHLSQGY